MAHKEMKAELTCPICMELFRQPRRLTCGHAYCQHCIATLLQIRAQQESWTPYRRLVCPECRDEMPVDYVLGIEALPIDFKLARLVEVLRSMEPNNSNSDDGNADYEVNQNSVREFMESRQVTAPSSPSSPPIPPPSITPPLPGLSLLIPPSSPPLPSTSPPPSLTPPATSSIPDSELPFPGLPRTEYDDYLDTLSYPQLWAEAQTIFDNLSENFRSSRETFSQIGRATRLSRRHRFRSQSRSQSPAHLDNSNSTLSSSSSSLSLLSSNSDSERGRRRYRDNLSSLSSSISSLDNGNENADADTSIDTTTAAIDDGDDNGTVGASGDITTTTQNGREGEDDVQNALDYFGLGSDYMEPIVQFSDAQRAMLLEAVPDIDLETHRQILNMEGPRWEEFHQNFMDFVGNNPELCDSFLRIAESENFNVGAAAAAVESNNNEKNDDDSQIDAALNDELPISDNLTSPRTENDCETEDPRAETIREFLRVSNRNKLVLAQLSNERCRNTDNRSVEEEEELRDSASCSISYGLYTRERNSRLPRFVGSSNADNRSVEEEEELRDSATCSISYGLHTRERNSRLPRFVGSRNATQNNAIDLGAVSEEERGRENSSVEVDKEPDSDSRRNIPEIDGIDFSALSLEERSEEKRKKGNDNFKIKYLKMKKKVVNIFRDTYSTTESSDEEIEQERERLRERERQKEREENERKSLGTNRHHQKYEKEKRKWRMTRKLMALIVSDDDDSSSSDSDRDSRQHAACREQSLDTDRNCHENMKRDYVKKCHRHRRNNAASKSDDDNSDNDNDDGHLVRPADGSNRKHGKESLPLNNADNHIDNDNNQSLSSSSSSSLRAGNTNASSLAQRSKNASSRQNASKSSSNRNHKGHQGRQQMSNPNGNPAREKDTVRHGTRMSSNANSNTVKSPNFSGILRDGGNADSSGDCGSHRFDRIITTSNILQPGFSRRLPLNNSNDSNNRNRPVSQRRQLLPDAYPVPSIPPLQSAYDNVRDEESETRRQQLWPLSSSNQSNQSFPNRFTSNQEDEPLSREVYDNIGISTLQPSQNDCHNETANSNPIYSSSNSVAQHHIETNQSVVSLGIIDENERTTVKTNDTSLSARCGGGSASDGGGGGGGNDAASRGNVVRRRLPSEVEGRTFYDNVCEQEIARAVHREDAGVGVGDNSLNNIMGVTNNGVGDVRSNLYTNISDTICRPEIDDLKTSYDDNGGDDSTNLVMDCSTYADESTIELESSTSYQVLNSRSSGEEVVEEVSKEEMKVRRDEDKLFCEMESLKEGVGKAGVSFCGEEREHSDGLVRENRRNRPQNLVHCEKTTPNLTIDSTSVTTAVAVTPPSTSGTAAPLTTTTTAASLSTSNAATAVPGKVMKHDVKLKVKDDHFGHSTSDNNKDNKNSNNDKNNDSNNNLYAINDNVSTNGGGVGHSRKENGDNGEAGNDESDLEEAAQPHSSMLKFSGSRGDGGDDSGGVGKKPKSRFRKFISSLMWVSSSSSSDNDEKDDNDIEGNYLDKDSW